MTEKEKDYHFNHRNAWSRAELESLLNSAGFKVVTMDKNAVLKECADFPGISAMEEQSLYCLAVGA